MSSCSARTPRNYWLTLRHTYLSESAIMPPKMKLMRRRFYRLFTSLLVLHVPRLGYGDRLASSPTIRLFRDWAFSL